MAAFFPNVLDKFLSPTFLEGVRNKYHYEETQASEIQVVAEEMLPFMQGYLLREINIKVKSVT